MPIDKFGRHMFHNTPYARVQSADIQAVNISSFCYKLIIPIYSQHRGVQPISGSGAVINLYALNGTGEVTFPLDEGVVENVEIFPKSTLIYYNKVIDPTNLKERTLRKGDTLAFTIDLKGKDPLYVVIVVKCPLQLK